MSKRSISSSSWTPINTATGLPLRVTTTGPPALDLTKALNCDFTSATDAIFWVYLLSADEQAIPFFRADGQNPNCSSRFIDVIQDAKPVVGAKTNLPLSGESRWLPQGFAVSGFDTGIEL